MNWAVWTVLTVLALVGSIYLLRAHVDAGVDDSAMPAAARRFLVAYLLSVVVVLAYLVVKLFSVSFSEVQCTHRPIATFDAPDKSVPKIEQLHPSCVVAGSSMPSLIISGHNFTDHSKIRLNGVERSSQINGDDTALVALHPSELINPGILWLEVGNEGKLSFPAEFAVVPPSDLKIPVSLFGYGFRMNPEMRLVLLVLVAGALGSYIHAIKSLADFMGNRTLTTSWFWWYVTRPFLGMPLAFIFYAALRGGFLVGTPADVKAVSPFGAFTVAALVGMFADKASQKLGELFDTLFRTEDPRKDKLAPTAAVKSLAPSTIVTGSLPPTLEIVGQNLAGTKFVRINSDDRPPDSVSPNKITLKLRLDDVAKNAKLSVAVVSDQGASPSLSLYITDLAISTEALPPVTAKTAYDERLKGSGGIGTLCWDVKGLPNGLKCSDAGELTGTATETGTHVLTATIKDSSGAQVSKELKLEVNP
jgi:Putative Ig domain